MSLETLASHTFFIIPHERSEFKVLFRLLLDQFGVRLKNPNLRPDFEMGGDHRVTQVLEIIFLFSTELVVMQG